MRGGNIVEIRKGKVRKCASITAGFAIVAGVELGSTVYADTNVSPVTLYVSASAGTSTGNGSQGSPYQTIGAAVQAATTGSTIIVEPGTYKEMVTITKPLTFESDPTTNAVNQTIIDATGEQNGILIQGNAASGTKIIRLTIENAQQAGILATGPISDLVIDRNVISNNAIGPISKDVDYEALHLMSATNSYILSNWVTNNADGGIYLTDEFGPNSHNVVKGNYVANNKIDCGITLASHVANAGVFDNVVEDNVSVGNGAAGIILATPVPGGAVYNNVITQNIVNGNGLGGIGLHTHAPGSNVSNNIITDNGLNGNAPDFGVTTVPTAIAIGASGSPITNTTVIGNSVTNEVYGVYSTTLGQNTFVSGNFVYAQNSYVGVTPN